MLVSGTLANRANAGFEPTPARYAHIITDHILAFAPTNCAPVKATLCWSRASAWAT